MSDTPDYEATQRTTKAHRLAAVLVAGAAIMDRPRTGAMRNAVDVHRDTVRRALDGARSSVPGDEVRSLAADLAQVRPPSDTTWAEVITVLEQQLAALEPDDEDPFRGLPR